MKRTHIKFIIEQFKNFNTKETQIKIIVFILLKNNQNNVKHTFLN